MCQAYVVQLKQIIKSHKADWSCNETACFSAANWKNRTMFKKKKFVCASGQRSLETCSEEGKSQWPLLFLYLCYALLSNRWGFCCCWYCCIITVSVPPCTAVPLVKLSFAFQLILVVAGFCCFAAVSLLYRLLVCKAVALLYSSGVASSRQLLWFCCALVTVYPVFLC